MRTVDEASDEEKRERDLLAHEAWGEGLSRPQFAERELALRAQRWAASGVMTTWALRAEGGRILASCETFRMPTLIDGAPAGDVYAVASVYTELALRGRGYATGLLNALGDLLRERDPGAAATVLFSDVGTAIYERSGYVARPAVNRVARAEPGDPASGVDELFTDEAPEARERAVTGFFPASREGLWLVPSGAQIDWHRERERLYARYQGRPALGAWGARKGRGSVIWAADWKNNRLLGLLYRAHGDAEALALLTSMRRVAASAGLARVVLWDDPFEPWPASFVAMPREDAIPMIRPFAAGLRPEAWARIPRGVWV
jgi:GNAT superfamily N-acetyltransferase